MHLLLGARRRPALFLEEPDQPRYVDYRRWAYESAALDLALRQAGRSLGEAVGRGATDLIRRFDGTRIAAVHEARPRVARALPGTRFKLDASPEWTDELVAELAATGAVDSIDLKGHYRGTVVDNPADPACTAASPRRCPTPGSRTPR